MIHLSPVLVIAGSVRPTRICLQIAEWVAEAGREATGEAYEVVDLKAWPLPMDDEPDVPAAAADYAHPHTRAWSRKIAGADAFVFVTPQYNWGYPAALKNALDHLYREWTGKPALIVTYGGHGGERCAEQLRQVLQGLRMQPLAAAPGFTLTREQIVANTGAISPAADFADQLDALAAALRELAAARAVHRP